MSERPFDFMELGRNIAALPADQRPPGWNPGTGRLATIDDDGPRGVYTGEECTEEPKISPQGQKALAKRAAIEEGKFSRRLEEFQAEMTNALNGKAEDKGYSSGGDSGGRPMLDAVALIAGEGTHPIGEIIYKLSRWKAKKNPEDLVKAAAWAFLMWDQQKREGK